MLGCHEVALKMTPLVSGGKVAKSLGRQTSFAAVLVMGLINAGVPTDKVARVEADLLKVRTAGSPSAEVARQTLVGLSSVPEKDHAPTQSSLKAFAFNLVENLSKAGGPTRPMKRLATNLCAVLRSAGVSSSEVNAALSTVQEELRLMGISQAETAKLVEQLRGIGREVRGPEDIPAR